ncbi:MAG: HD domain-containing protein [Lachnospiraceae bacterium]|nr:HD domain-containing protein [Lachnospiraceae bacterium]
MDIEKIVDFEKAKQVFEEYLNGYDREDDRIKLKIIHTYCVVDCSREIALRMKLSNEDVQLAMLIGLLHDIGRFEQLKRYDSFEASTMDHAAQGVQTLFEEGMIRQFIQDDQFDELIRTAIAKHSDFKLEGIEDERILLHARLIRDADKLDNYRVKLEETTDTLLRKTPEEIGQEVITDKVFEDACHRKSIFSPDRKTAMDYWVSYIVYIYDINFKETLQIIKEKNYVPAIIHRIPYSNPDTIEKMNRIEMDVMDYISF